MWQRKDRTGRMSSRQAHQATGKARRSLRMSVSFAVEPLERRLLLSAPAAPVITANPSASTVVLAWNTVTGATKYNVYRGTQSGQETTLVKTTQGATTWTDTTLTNGASYYYEVTALDSSSEESVKSNEASFIPQATNTIGPSNVLVIYNEDWAGDQDGNGVQDSLQVAEYYAQVHGVPLQNLVGIHGGATTLSSGWDTWDPTPYTTFYNNVVTPVDNALNTLGQNNIDVLLFCYGVNDLAPTGNTSPTAISLDDDMAAPFLLTSTSGIAQLNPDYNPYFDPAPGFDTSPGHFTHNFTVTYGGHTSPLYLVSRLDGPRGLWDALEQIDQAQYAQKYLYAGAGYFNGTVYVDDEARDANYTDAWLQNSTYVRTGNYSNYGPADENIAETEHYVLNSGLTLKWQNTGALIGDTGATFTDGSSATSAPNALFYSGWYGWHNTNPVFQWLPGSVADNLISNSMVGLEGNGVPGTQTVEQLGMGLTAGVGTVAEPGVDGHPRPNILTYYLLQGYSFAEAAMLSTPYLGFMGLAIGDPLYTPLDPNKTPVKDTTTPAPAASFNPAAGYWDASGNYHLNLSIDNSNGPEVAAAVLQYGLTTSYGSTASSTAFYERPDLTLTGLTPGLTYYLKLTLTNPVGTAATYTYSFTVPPKTIYLDTFTSQGSFRYKYPTLTTLANGTAGRWDSGGGTGTANETGSGVTLTNNNYYFLPLSNINLSTTAGTYTLTAQATSTGASNQWLALGFGVAANGKLTTANAIATLSGPGGPASTYYGTGTAASTGHPATGTVIGNGVDTLSIILVTDGNGNATVSFSDTAGLLPPNSGGTLTPAQLANIGAIFIASNGTAAGTFNNLTLTFTPADTSTTSVTSSLNPSAYGQSVTFTATVAAGHPGTGTPSGTVTFMDGTTTLGTGALNGSGIATFTTSTLSAASHSITAVYAGDADHTGSTASAVTQTVVPEIPGKTDGVTASDGTDPDQVQVAWTAVDGATGYDVWRSTSNDSSTAVQLNSTDISGTTFDDTTAAPGTVYWYWVTAKNAAGSGAFSDPDSGYEAPAVSGSFIFDTAGNADSYYLKVDPTGNYLQISFSTVALAVPTYQIALTQLTSLNLNLLGTSNTVYVDFSGGSPVPTDNITIICNAAAQDELEVIGNNPSQVFTMTDTQIGLANGPGIAFQNLATLAVSNLVVYYSGTLSTIQNLDIEAGTTFAWGSFDPPQTPGSNVPTGTTPNTATAGTVTTPASPPATTSTPVNTVTSPPAPAPAPPSITVNNAFNLIINVAASPSVAAATPASHPRDGTSSGVLVAFPTTYKHPKNLPPLTRGTSWHGDRTARVVQKIDAENGVQLSASDSSE